MSPQAVGYLDSFETTDQTFLETKARSIQADLSHWRSTLPPELQLAHIQQWNVANFWVLVLMVRAYLFECLLFRKLAETTESQGNRTSQIASEGLRIAMFELDTVIERLVLYDLAKFCPLYL
jgi:hypothetical protein